MKLLVTAALASLAAAVIPGMDKTMGMYQRSKRQFDALAALGLQDPDIANFALTLEWLEGTFYRDCIAQLGLPAFQAAGLNQQQIDNLVKVGATEFEHASFLQGFLARAGAAPVQPCQYQFPCGSVQEMVTTAVVLETVGISAYAGAAQFVTDPNVLTAAATILSIEAKHSTFMRELGQLLPVPQAFDAALDPRSVFTLAAPFFVSCPAGSNLALTARPFVTQVNPPAGQPLIVDQVVQLQSDASAGATNCAWISGGIPTNVVFTTFDQSGACQVPQLVGGVSYVMLTNAAPLDGVLAEAQIIAGPAAVLIT